MSACGLRSGAQCCRSGGSPWRCSLGPAELECTSQTCHCIASGVCTNQLLAVVPLQVPLGDIGIAYGQVSRFAAEQLGEEYSEDGQTLRLTIRVQVAHVEFATTVADMSSGRIRALDAEGQTEP